MTNAIFPPRGAKNEIENGATFQPKFDSDGLIACVVTDADSGEVLMVGYMNDEALRRTLESRQAWYWSRSRQEYWRKGATSGQTQTVVEILTDCDQDALVMRVKVGGDGGTCHVGYRACFYRSVVMNKNGEIQLRHTGAELLNGR